MLGLGPGELVVVLIIALVIFGPGKLPDVGNALGKSIREFRKATSEVTEELSKPARVEARDGEGPKGA